MTDTILCHVLYSVALLAGIGVGWVAWGRRL